MAERLTNNAMGGKCYGFTKPCDDMEHLQLVADKLGVLEDCEDALGIDLFLFSKLIKSQFVFVKIGEKISSKYEFIGINFNQNNALILYNEDNQEMYTSDLYFEDYGITWALTKEELK